MIQGFETFQKNAKDSAEATLKTFGTVTKGYQTVATEAADFAKKSFELGSANVEKLVAAKSFEKAVEIQNEYVKTSYEGFVAYATKVGQLYTAIAKDAYKPFEFAIPAFKAGK